MANKTVLKKEKNLHSRREVVTSHPVMRALIYLFIHLSKPPNCITEFSALTRTPSRKYIYFWKTMINTAAKSILVQLCYYMTKGFSSTFSRINRQTSIPTEKCFKPIAQMPCGRVGKRKYNLINGISTALRRHFRWKLFTFSEFPGL